MALDSLGYGFGDEGLGPIHGCVTLARGLRGFQHDTCKDCGPYGLGTGS